MEDFKKYMEAKKCLYKMVCQFYTSYIPINEIKSSEYEDDYVEMCFHQFNSDGILAWNYLNIDKNFITLEEMWDLEENLKYEKPENIDYYDEYLKICILLIDMTTKYYSKKVDLEEVKDNIKYDEDDVYDGKVNVCYHYCEGAGESVWNLLNIEDEIVGNSVFENKRKYFTNELLNKEDVKTLKKRMLYEEEDNKILSY